MSIVERVNRNLGLQIAVKLGAVLLGMIVIATAAITWQQTKGLEQATMEKARVTATMGARQYGDMLDEAIDSGTLTVNEVFDTNYVKIKGWDWGSKPKYHTAYDTFVDRAALVFQDKILENNPEFVYAVGTDVNGYVPTHNTVAQRPLDGSEHDLLENRTKRIYNTNTTEVNRSRNVDVPFLLQVYHRDTGETMWDASAPIWVKGKHWGAFVLGVSMKKLDERKHQLVLTLVGMFALVAIVTLGLVYALVDASMKPVRELTAAADRISVGEALEEPIKTERTDEIGALTKSVNRLRASMKAAMARLGQ